MSLTIKLMQVFENAEAEDLEALTDKEIIDIVTEDMIGFFDRAVWEIVRGQNE